MGIFKTDANEFLNSVNAEKQNEIPSQVLELVEARKTANAKRDYALADSIRAEITKLGYSVLDTRDGVKIEKI